MRNPHTKQEWQEAVDAAWVALCLDSARAYGLFSGGPAVNARRCEDILKAGRVLGIVPARDAVERWVAGMVA